MLTELTNLSPFSMVKAQYSATRKDKLDKSQVILHQFENAAQKNMNK